MLDEGQDRADAVIAFKQIRCFDQMIRPEQQPNLGLTDFDAAEHGIERHGVAAKASRDRRK